MILVTIPVPTKGKLIDITLETNWDKLTGLATLTQSEARTNFSGNIVDETAYHLNVVAGHDHLFLCVGRLFGPRQPCADIRSADEELGSVVGHEGSVTTSLILSEDLRVRLILVPPVVSGNIIDSYVDLSLELLDGLHRARGNDDLATTNLLTLDATKQGTHIITSFSLLTV